MKLAKDNHTARTVCDDGRRHYGDPIKGYNIIALELEGACMDASIDRTVGSHWGLMTSIRSIGL